MSGGREWTTGEVRLMHELRSKRVRVRQIGKIIDRTPNSIYAYLRYDPAAPGKPAGIKPTDRLPPLPKAPVRTDYWTRDQLSMMRDLAEEGASARQAAEALGRSYNSVRTKASKIGLRFWSRRNVVYRLEQETTRYHKNAEQGSTKLLEALLDMAA